MDENTIVSMQSAIERTTSCQDPTDYKSMTYRGILGQIMTTFFSIKLTCYKFYSVHI